MSKKDDMFAALDGRQPDNAVPIWELEFQAWDAVSGRHMVLGREFEKLSSAGQENALHVNAEIMLTVCESLYFAALTLPGGYWEQSPGELAYYCLPGEAPFRQLEVVRALAPDNLALVAKSGGVMGMPDSQEYMEFSYKLYDDPEAIEARARTCLSQGIDYVRRLTDYGVDLMLTTSDMADNHGPFFSPDQMDRFILPYLRQWVSAVKKEGKYAVLHSDGNLMQCLDGLADSGVHALQAIDPVAGMDICAVKARTMGKLCLCGNVDCGLMLTGSPENIYEVTRDLLSTCKVDGSFVLGCSNALQPEVRIENYLAMVEAWREYGQY